MLSKDLKKVLIKNCKQNEETEQGKCEIYLTDTETNFIRVAKKLLKDDEILQTIKKEDFLE